MLWGTSSLALYIPWGGKAGPYLGICLWLWLGVLDAIQGVGLGMILLQVIPYNPSSITHDINPTIILQTLSRLHVCATLAFSQIIGSICVMVARATAPNRIGPESVFPDAGTWDFQTGLKGSPLASATFWIALTCQLIIVIGYFWFYRKEQLGEFIDLFCLRSSVLTCCTSTSMMAISFLYLPCTYSGLFFNYGLLDSFCVVEHCIWAFANHILFILRRTGYMDLPRFTAGLVVLRCLAL